MQIKYNILLAALTEYFAARRKKRPNDETVLELVIPQGASIKVVTEDGEPVVGEIYGGVEFSVLAEDSEEDEEDDEDSEELDEEKLVKDYAKLTEKAPMSPMQVATALEVDVRVLARALNHFGEEYLTIVGNVEEDGKTRKLWMAKGTEAHATFVAEQEKAERAAADARAEAVAGLVKKHYGKILRTAMAGKRSTSSFKEAVFASLTEEERTEMGDKIDLVLQVMRDRNVLFQNHCGNWSAHRDVLPRVDTALSGINS